MSERRHLSDLGNGERLADAHEHELRFVAGLSTWLYWDERRWARDRTGTVLRWAWDVARGIAYEARVEDDFEDRKAILRWALKSESDTRLKAMVRLAQAHPALYVTPEQLDADPDRLVVANGELDLRNGELRRHDPVSLCTRLADVPYNDDAECPTFERFLETVLRGDDELIAFLQRAVGYSLTGHTGEQVLIVLTGPGANGKSTLVETLRALLGDYGLQAPAEMLLSRSRDGGGPAPELVRLRGARFVAAVETGEGRHLAEPLVKAVTGGDTITARPLYGDFIEFRPAFKLWLATNHLPTVRGTDEAIWRRIRTVPFDVTIPAEERDPHLVERLRRELPGILRWAVEGALAWRADGLGTASRVHRATSAYRTSMDVLGVFLAEHCTLSPDMSTPASELYAAYRGWAEASGEKPLSKQQLGQRLVERGLEARRTRQARLWSGIALLPTTSEVTW